MQPNFLLNHPISSSPYNLLHFYPRIYHQLKNYIQWLHEDGDLVCLLLYPFAVCQAVGTQQMCV